MPDLGFKLHDGRAEGVLARNLDIDKVGCALVWCIRWPQKLTAQMCEVFPVACRFDDNLGVLIIVDVGNLLCNAPVAVGSHRVRVRVRRRVDEGAMWLKRVRRRKEFEERSHRQQVGATKVFLAMGQPEG